MYSKKKLIRNIVLVVALLIFILIIALQLGDIKQIYNVLTTQTNYLYLLLALLVVFIYCIIWQFSLTVLIRNNTKDISVFNCLLISGSEFFFNGITPFSSGGQPFQAYALKNKGMKYSDSTSVLLINFLIYQIIINILAIVSLCLYYTKINESISNLAWLIFVGFSINFFVMMLIILVGTNKFVANLIKKFLVLLSKIKFLKKFLEPRLVAFDNYVNEVQTAFKDMYKHLFVVFVSTILKLIGQLLYNSIPFIILIAVGVNLNINDIFYVIGMTSFALTVAVWVPTPGSSGGMELAFTTLFSTLLLSYEDASSVAVSAMLIWRFFTYYLLMIYGLILYFLYEKGGKSDENRNVHGSVLSEH